MQNGRHKQKQKHFFLFKVVVVLGFFCSSFSIIRWLLVVVVLLLLCEIRNDGIHERANEDKAQKIIRNQQQTTEV